MLALEAQGSGGGAGGRKGRALAAVGWQGRTPWSLSPAVSTAELKGRWRVRLFSGSTFRGPRAHSSPLHVLWKMCPGNTGHLFALSLPLSSHVLFLHHWLSTWRCSRAPAPLSTSSWLSGNPTGPFLPLPLSLGLSPPASHTRSRAIAEGNSSCIPSRRLTSDALSERGPKPPNQVPRSPELNSLVYEVVQTGHLCVFSFQALLLLLVPKSPTQKRRKEQGRWVERWEWVEGCGKGWGEAAEGSWPGLQVPGCHLLHGHEICSLLICQVGMLWEH